MTIDNSKNEDKTKSHTRNGKTAPKIRITKINSINNITYATLDNNSHACIRTDHVTRKMAPDDLLAGICAAMSMIFPGLRCFFVVFFWWKG